MKKDDVRTLIVVLGLCGICVLLVLLFNIKSNSEKLSYVKEYNTFFNVTNEVNQYLNYANSDNLEKLYSVLSEYYLEDSSVNMDNVGDKVKLYPVNSSLKVGEIKSVNIKNNYLYFVTGRIILNEYETSRVLDENFKIIVFNDFDNKAFAVYPLEEDNYKKIINKIKKINIIFDDYNKIVGSNLVTSEQMCVLYLSDYINRINDDTPKSYSVVSDKTKKSYSTVQSYVTYINSIRDKMTTVVDKCAMDNFKEGKVYYVIDSNGNKFTFQEENILDYKVDFYFK